MGLVDLSQSAYKNNLQAKNWLYGNITEAQYRLEVFANSIKYNLTSCPLEKPYVNIQSYDCFDCPVGLKFNLGTKLCEVCPEGTKYNLTLNDCVNICILPEVFNATTKNCEIPNNVNDTKNVTEPTVTTNDTKSWCPP